MSSSHKIKKDRAGRQPPKWRTKFPMHQHLFFLALMHIAACYICIFNRDTFYDTKSFLLFYPLILFLPLLTAWDVNRTFFYDCDEKE